MASAPASAPPVIRFTLPLPPSGLAPNRAQGHAWQATQAEKDAYRAACQAICKSARVDAQKHGGVFPLAPVVTMVLTFVLPTKRRRDGDGLLSAFKTGVDAMVRSGLLRDDSIWELRVALEGELGAPGCVRVRLEAGS